MKKQIKTRFGYIHWRTNMFLVLFLFVCIIGALVLFSPIWDETPTSDMSEYAQAAINSSTDSEEENIQDAIDGIYESEGVIINIIGIVLIVCTILGILGVIFNYC